MPEEIILNFITLYVLQFLALNHNYNFASCYWVVAY
jgi:hypothetical protein